MWWPRGSEGHGGASSPGFPKGRARRPSRLLFLGLFFIALGLTLLLFELRLLDEAEAIGAALSSLGSILMLDAFVRHRLPWTRHKTVPYAVLGALFIALGAAFSLGLREWWPLVLVALGLSSIAYGLSRFPKTELSRLEEPGGR